MEIRGLEVDGIEFELKGSVTEKLDLVLGYSNADGTTSSGGEPREIPDSTFTVWASYTASDKFGWALGVMKQGESNIKDNNPGLVLPDYTRVDFAAYYDVNENLTIQVNVENLTDELYFPHSHSTHQASVGEPRNTRISLRRNF
jgi:catecholate siderophore receptor